uniref:Major facilitator superfamily (MFS) profile domain-containing protein n=1 Tax=Panagrolaimus sp. PS1159 TaxID=55785 RepID=A0AC35G393_9BILA
MGDSEAVTAAAKSEEEEHRKTSSFNFLNCTRFVILFVTLLALIFAFGNSLIYNFTIICMSRKAPVLDKNGTQYFIIVQMFSQKEEGLLYSAIAIGSFVGSLSVVYLARFFGARIVFTVYGGISGVATLLSPICANWGFVPLFIMRILQGIGAGMTFTSIGFVTGAWSPLASSGLFLSWLTTYIQLAPLFTMPLSGLFCALTLIAFTLFYFVYRDTPRFHRNVSNTELAKIENAKNGISMDKKSKPLKVPYFKILTDKVIIGILFTCFGNFLGFQVFMQFAPVYLNQVLKLDIEKTGVMSALPYLGCLILKFIVGPLSDSLTCISQLTSVKLYTALSQFTMAICLFVMATVPPHLTTISQIAYTIAIIGGSLNSVGFYKATQLYSGPFTSVIMSWFSLLNSAVVLFLPFLKTSIAAENRPEQWSKMFYIISAIVVCTTLFSIFTTEIEPRKWAIIKPNITVKEIDETET